MNRFDIHSYIWRDLNLDFKEQSSIFDDDDYVLEGDESLYSIIGREILKINGSKVFQEEIDSSNSPSNIS